MQLQAVLSNVLVLELHSGDFKDDEGKTINYHKLAVYEFAQKYPSLTLLKVPQSALGAARELVGKKVNLNVDLFIGNNNKSSMTFVGAA